jgi:spore germination protein YaaH
VTALAALAVVAHFYATNDEPSRRSLEKNRAHISIASPVGLAITASGEIRSSLDRGAIDWAARSKLRLMPVVVNQDFRPEAARAVLENEALQQSVIAELSALTEAEGFYGLSLDFEGLGAEHREAYARFAARLGEALRRRGRKLGVAVGAPLGTGLEPNEHSRVFDYAALARAADWVTLMTYDQYTSPGQPGPIAGYGWVEACVRRALQSIPAEKLLLGIPLYYRRWNGTRVTEGPYAEARALAARRRARIRMDSVHQAPTFRFREGGVWNVVWLENAASLRRRLELVKKYRLGGYSAWRLGQEDPAAWRSAFGRMPRL